MADHQRARRFQPLPRTPQRGCMIDKVSVFHDYSPNYIMEDVRVVVQKYYQGRAAHFAMEIEDLEAITHQHFKTFVLRRPIFLKEGELIRILVTDVSKLKRTTPCIEPNHPETYQLPSMHVGDKLIDMPQTPGLRHWSYTSPTMNMIPNILRVPMQPIRLKAKFYQARRPAQH
eukprot:TRINITY_DN12485_c0_g1_i5.p1 TRINITY_DN12485_c0_g1~~TRINITY_DN12485_c0_g1_i5.p1  ORF type:complete len:173 (+),score=21.25 TRINITY_DN12485_c0_g1_i5:1031-1549(+)